MSQRSTQKTVYAQTGSSRNSAGRNSNRNELVVPRSGTQRREKQHWSTAESRYRYPPNRCTYDPITSVNNDDMVGPRTATSSGLGWKSLSSSDKVYESTSRDASSLKIDQRYCFGTDESSVPSVQGQNAGHDARPLYTFQQENVFKPKRLTLSEQLDMFGPLVTSEDHTHRSGLKGDQFQAPQNSFSLSKSKPLDFFEPLAPDKDKINQTSQSDLKYTQFQAPRNAQAPEQLDTFRPLASDKCNISLSDLKDTKFQTQRNTFQVGYQLNDSLIKMTESCGKPKRIRLQVEPSDVERREKYFDPEGVQEQNPKYPGQSCEPNCTLHCKYCMKCFSTQYLANFHAQSKEHRDHVEQWVLENEGCYPELPYLTVFDLVLNEICQDKTANDLKYNYSSVQSHSFETTPSTANSTNYSKIKHFARNDPKDLQSQRLSEATLPSYNNVKVDMQSRASVSTTAEIRRRLNTVQVNDSSKPYKDRRNCDAENFETLSEFSTSTTAGICPEVRNLNLRCNSGNRDARSVTTTEGICQDLEHLETTSTGNFETHSQSTTTELRDVMDELVLNRKRNYNQTMLTEYKPTQSKTLSNFDGYSQSTTAELRTVIDNLQLNEQGSEYRSSSRRVHDSFKPNDKHYDTWSLSTTADIRPYISNLDINANDDMYNTQQHLTAKNVDQLNSGGLIPQDDMNAMVRPIDNLLSKNKSPGNLQGKELDNVKAEVTEMDDEEPYDRASHVPLVTQGSEVIGNHGPQPEDMDLERQIKFLNRTVVELKHMDDSLDETVALGVHEAGKYLSSVMEVVNGMGNEDDDLDKEAVSGIGTEADGLEMEAGSGMGAEADNSNMDPVREAKANNSNKVEAIQLVNKPIQNVNEREVFTKCPQNVRNCCIHCIPCDVHLCPKSLKNTHEKTRNHFKCVSEFFHDRLYYPDNHCETVGDWVSTSLDDHLSVLDERGKMKWYLSDEDKIAKLRERNPKLRETKMRVWRIGRSEYMHAKDHDEKIKQKVLQFRRERGWVRAADFYQREVYRIEAEHCTKCGLQARRNRSHSGQGRPIENRLQTGQTTKIWLQSSQVTGNRKQKKKWRTNKDFQSAAAGTVDNSAHRQVCVVQPSFEENKKQDPGVEHRPEASTASLSNVNDSIISSESRGIQLQDVNPSVTDSVWNYEDSQLQEVQDGIPYVEVGHGRIQVKQQDRILSAPHSTLSRRSSDSDGKDLAVATSSTTLCVEESLQCGPFIQTIPPADGCPRTSTPPKDHHVEMYKAAMQNNSICVLPIGPKENLVSVMMVDHVLTLNPSRPVLILVEKSSGVLHESSYLKSQIGKKVYARVDGKTGQRVRRELRIASSSSCDGFRDTHGTPLTHLDVLVMTRNDFFNDAKKQNQFKWSNFCLVVVPELQQSSSFAGFPLTPGTDRPKFLGFIKPNASLNTIGETDDMLRRLLKETGAKIYLGDQQRNMELQGDNCSLQLRLTKMNDSETDLELELQLYILKLLKILKLDPACILHSLISELGVNIEENKFDIVSVEALRSSLDCIISNQHLLKVDKGLVKISQHLICVCKSYTGLVYGSREIAIDLLSDLTKGMCSYGFNAMEEYVKPCPNLLKRLAAYNRRDVLASKECIDPLLPEMTAVNRVVRELFGVNWASRFEGDHPLVAVVTETPIMAQIYNNLFRRSSYLKMMDLNSDCLSGPDRDDVLKRVKENKTQILVMAVEDMTLDLPEMVLVIQLTPPCQLLQLYNPHMVPCRSVEEVEVVKKQWRRERNLMKAVAKLKSLFV